MGLVTGYISLLCFLLLAVKFIARKMRSVRWNSFLQRLHKPVSAVFMIACIIHLILTFPVWQTRTLSVMVSGSLGIVIAILLIYLCHTIKNDKRKIFWHRALAIVLLAAAVLHVVVYMIDFAQYRNHIKEIQIDEHGSPAESIVNHIIEEQRLTVDAVTGATNFSRVIQKACEDALGE